MTMCSGPAVIRETQTKPQRDAATPRPDQQRKKRDNAERHRGVAWWELSHATEGV